MAVAEEDVAKVYFQPLELFAIVVLQLLDF
jgi:hypothetical protein